MSWVTEYCNRAILIERGLVIMEGEPAEVVELHQAHTEEARARTAEAARRGRRRPADRQGPLRPALERAGAPTRPGPDAVSGGGGSPGRARRCRRWRARRASRAAP